MARRLFLLLTPLLGAHALGPSPSGLYDCALSQDLGCFRGAGDNGVSACLSPATTGRHLRVSLSDSLRDTTDAVHCCCSPRTPPTNAAGPACGRVLSRLRVAEASNRHQRDAVASIY